MAESTEVPLVEPSHLPQISDAYEIAREFNQFVQDQDFELAEVAEDFAEGPANSIIIEKIQEKISKPWNDQKRDTVHQILQQLVELKRAESDPCSAHNLNDFDNPPITTQKSQRESNADILNEIIKIAPIKDRTDNNNNNNNNEPITYPSNYKDIRFSEYHETHLAQFIYDDTNTDFNENANSSDLHHIIFENNINGKVLKDNLNDDWIKSRFNKQFKKSTIQYIKDEDNNNKIDETWDSDQVLKFLYFAESQTIQNAIIGLKINGKTFLEIGNAKEWHNRLKKYGKIPLSVTQIYYKKIAVHKMESAMNIQRSKSDSVSIKYEEEEEKRDNNNKLNVVSPKENDMEHLLISTDSKKRVNFTGKFSHDSFQLTPKTDNYITTIVETDEKEENKEDLDDNISYNIEDISDHDEDMGSSSDDNKSEFETRPPSIIGQPKHSKYPTYINKSLFHVSDDENLEVLVDEAVLKILSFNELWQDRDGFVRCLYSDKEFANAAKRVYDALAAAYEKEKFGFFEEFVSKQYAREIQEHSLQMERFYDENDEEEEEDLMEIDNDTDTDTASISIDEHSDGSGEKKDDIDAWCFEVDQNGNYRIFEAKKDRKSLSTMSINRSIYRINVKQNPEGFSWSMFKQGKKIKSNYNTYHGGYWWICDEAAVGRETSDWYNKLADIQKRKKQKMQFKKKGKVKKWVGPSIPLKHLNIILGLVHNHYKIMIDPAKRKKIWKKKRKKEPIFAKFLPKEMYIKKEEDDEDIKSDDDEDKEEKDEIDGLPINTVPNPDEARRKASLIVHTKNLEMVDRSKANNIKQSKYSLFPKKSHQRIEYIYDEKEEESVHLKIQDGDKEYLYDLFWWNSQSRSKVNAFCLKRAKDIDFKWQHYLFYRTNFLSEKISWEWYDNDQAEYKEYDTSQINVIKQLEATFQSNIQENFPVKYFHTKQNAKEPMFNYCQLPELQSALKENGVRVGLGFVTRFSFTKNKRINNIEQLSSWKDNAEFARNVRRMYDGKNSLYNYFKDKNEYIEEWKRLYLLDTDEQQMFFWSHILTVCACMKYTNIEFENQMVSFAFERVNNLDSSILSQMDFNDVQREIRDMISWDGFLIPPTNLFQTNDVRIDENDLTDEDWFKKQGYATILTQWESKYFQSNKKGKNFNSKIKSRQIYCGHDIDPRYQTYWQTTTGYTYCDSCAKLLQFAECIRKFVLEYENDEVVELLWPWYRNTFHAGSVDKYGKYINKYNLSHLYMEYDLLPDFANRDEDDTDHTTDNESFFCCWNRANKGYRASEEDQGCFAKCLGDEANTDKDYAQLPHIRHRRKFAAQLLLGGWDTLRNLNVIRQQLLPIMNSFITSEIVDEETHYGDGKNRRAVEKHRLNIKFETKEYLADRRYWWIDKIGDINTTLRANIEENDWKTLFNFEHHDSLEIKRQHAVVFNEFVTVFLEDDREIDKENDPDQYTKDYPNEYFREFLAQCTRTPKWWHLEHDKLLLELSLRFNYSSEKFLKELTGTKKRYYQYRLRSKPAASNIITNNGGGLEDGIGDIDVGSDDETDTSRPKGRNMDIPIAFVRQMTGGGQRSPWDEKDESIDFGQIETSNQENKEAPEQFDEEIGYQEFKAWCQVTENIMHRLKYVTFLIIKKLTECSPSVIDLRIPNKGDQPTFDGTSYIFLNNYMRKTHVDFCENYEKEPDDILEIAGTINEASKYIIAHRQNWKQIQKDLQIVAHSQPAKPQHAVNQLSRKKSKDVGRTQTDITGAYQRTMMNVMRATNTKSKFALPNAMPSNLKIRSTSYIADAFRSQRSIQNLADNPRRGHFNHSRTATHNMTILRRRTRDPFLRRDLTREFQEVVQSFDLLQNGELMAHFIIQLLKTKQLPSLWQALGILLRIIPYKLALRILHETRGELRHGDPEDVAKVCREVMDGSNFLVPAALYLAELMEKNASEDLAREQEWRDYSKYYERVAQQQINSIESDHLLAVLMDVPIYIKDLNLLQLALEQDRIQFLNNERINGVMSHVWYASAFLDPTEDIEKGNQDWIQLFMLLFQRPFQFYLTPMGFNWTTGLCYMGYLLGIAIYILYDPVYPEDAVSYGEWLLWICNIGYILNEVLEFVDQGRQYFAVNGLLNYFDIIISGFWLILFGIRIHSYVVGEWITDPITGYEKIWISPYQQGGWIENDDNFWVFSRVYTTLWAFQLVLLCFRSLAVFLSSQYIGILFRMIELMMGQIVRFGFFIMTILIGFLFGLYYIDNIPNKSDDIGHGDNDGVYDHFLYLFTSLVGMAEVETHLKVGDEDNGEEEDPMKVIAQAYSILFIVFGTILSMNLLIALMTAEFDRVRSRANTEYAYARAELTYDLSHRNRFMAPPLNIFVLAIAVIIHIINFFPALLFPDTLNIYYYLATGHYDFLRNFSFLDWICCSIKKRGKNNKRSFRRKSRLETVSTDASISGSSEFNSNDGGGSCKDRCCGTLFCWFKCYGWCCKPCNGCYGCSKRCKYWQGIRKKKGHTFLMNTTKLVLKYYFPSNWIGCIGKKTQWNVYHAGCYNCIAKQRIEEKFESHAFHGIAMNQYFNIYETQRKTKLDALDKNLLKHLTVNTLFCQYCYRPFDKEHMEDQLITPFWALADIVSCWFFTIFVWWILIILIGLVSFLTVCKNSCNNDISSGFTNDDNDDETDEFREYDREYWGSTSNHIEITDLKTKQSNT